MTKRTLEQIEAEVEAAVDALRRLTDEDIDILEGSYREFVFRMASALAGCWRNEPADV